jgi:PAS domain S-box-containing protein
MEDYLAMVRRAMEGEPSLGLVRYRRKNGGSPLICNISAAPQRNAQGQAIGVTIIVEDITARHQAEEAVRESQQLLHLVLETLPVGVAVTDRAGNIILVNAASKRIWGDTIVSGRERWTQTKGFWHDSGQRIAPENWASVRALSEGQTSLNELIDIDTYDGQQKTILNSSAPIRNPAGVIVGAVFVNEDVTERVRAEEALHQLTGQLLRLQDEERRRLARELHDATAQKLAVLLLGLKSLTAQASSLDARAQESLAECQALAKQCADELRTFSYLLHPPLLEELGLAGAVRDYADGFAQRSGLRVDLEVSPSLERLPREKELAIFRVLQESLANVHRHSGSKTVSIRLTQLRGEIRLEVQDAGRGLELKTDPASGEKAPSKLGVGVAGMRERLRQLGGRLEFESGHPGTTVRASLPLDQSGSEHSDDQNPDCRRS